MTAAIVAKPVVTVCPRVPTIHLPFSTTSVGWVLPLLFAAGPACVPVNEVDKGATGDIGWTSYGGEPTGTRYSPLAEINTTNVHRMRKVWGVRTGDIEALGEMGSRARFQTTPSVHEGLMYVITPLNRVLALDATTGSRVWMHDPEVRAGTIYDEGLTSRGVAIWTAANSNVARVCHTRVFAVTVDARLLALDGLTGRPCPDFGTSGYVDLDPLGRESEGGPFPGSFSVTSPPTVVGDIVAVGSAINKGSRPRPAAGEVRAYDASTGEEVWRFQPLDVAENGIEYGGGNVWSVMSADTSEGVLYAPTAGPAPDHYGGDRPGANEYANSVLALDSKSGSLVWGWQAVRHDLWDYDVAAQPLLAALRLENREIPVVFVGTKTGMIFVLHRGTGVPVLEVQERQVAASDVDGEIAAPTQLFATRPPPLAGTFLSPDSAFGIDPVEREFCRRALAALRNEGMFTPPSLGGSLLWPGVWGGINWGSMAWHPVEQILVTSVMRVGMGVQLHSEENRTVPRVSRPGEQFHAYPGIRYSASRWPLVGPSGLPCTPPPWSSLVAVRFPEGLVEWSVPLGTIPGTERISGSEEWGSIAFGGPLVTAGGLVLIAASQDKRVRAFDIRTGDLLWSHELPASGNATPMTFSVDGRQYVTIVAGGRQGLSLQGDWVVTFALR